MKSLRFFIMALLCAVFCNAKAAEEVVYTLNPAAGTNNSYTGNCDVTIDDITWNITGNSQMIPWRIGGKSISGEDRTVYSKTKMNDEISKVELTVGSASNITVNSLTLTVASNEDFSTVIENVSATFAANSTITFSPSEGKKWENAYFKFTFNVTVSGSSNKFVEFVSAQFYTLSSTSTVATPTFSPAGGTYTSAQNVTISCETTGATIHYTTDGSVPTASSPTYSSSSAISVSTTTTIKAIAVKNEMTNSSVAEATYTFPNSISEVRAMTEGSQICTRGVVTGSVSGRNYIQDANAAICVYSGQLIVGTEYVVQGTLNTYNGLLQIKDHTEKSISTGNTVNPEVMTISNVLNNCGKSSNKQGWLVKIENAVVTDKTNTYTTITQGDYSINVYGITNVEYAINDKLTLTGNISYNNSGRIECPTNVIVTKAPVLTISPESATVSSEGGEGSFTISSTNVNFGNVTISFNYYESESAETPSTTLPNWLTLTVSDDYSKIDYAVDANNDAARSAYFELVLTSSEFDGGKLISNIFSISQEKYAEPAPTRIYRKVTSTADITNGNYLIVYESDGVAFNGGLDDQHLDSKGNLISVEINNGVIADQNDAYFTYNVTDKSLKSASGKFIGGKGKDTNGITISDNTITNTLSIDNENVVIISNGAYMRFNANSDQKWFRYFKSSTYTNQKAIQLYKEVLPFELVIHPKATDGKNNYYATISNLGKGNFVVPEGLEVSTITIVNRNINKTQSWTKDGVIPGDKAYYVVAAGLENPTPDDLTFTFVPSTNTEEISLQANWLYPAIAGQEITAPDDENEYLFYKLTLDADDTDGSIGFYFGDDNGGTFSFSNDHKAYLAVPQNGDSNEGLSSIAVGDFTGISDIQPNKEQNNEVYTLSGVRVKGNLPKGIYIVNGKKQIVK